MLLWRIEPRAIRFFFEALVSKLFQDFPHEYFNGIFISKSTSFNRGRKYDAVRFT